MYYLADLVRDTLASAPGTGSATLAGSPPTGFVSFATGLGSSSARTCYKLDDGGSHWEIGVGTFNGTTGLSRDRILASSNSGSAVNFSTGTINARVVAPAELIGGVPNPGFNRSRWYGAQRSGGTGNTAVTASTLYAVPIFIPDFCEITSIGFYVVTLVAGSFDLGIYSPKDGLPNNLLWSLGSTALAAGGNIATPNLFVSPGYVWLAGLLTTASTVIMTTTSADEMGYNLLGFSSVSDNVSSSGLRQGVTAAGQSSPLPSVFPSATFPSSNFPDIRIQVT